MIRFVMRPHILFRYADAGLSDYDITREVIGAEKLHWDLMGFDGSFEYPELSFVVDNSADWLGYYNEVIVGSHAVLGREMIKEVAVYDDEVLLFYGRLLSITPAVDFVGKTVSFTAEFLTAEFKNCSPDVVFWNQARENFGLLGDFCPLPLGEFYGSVAYKSDVPLALTMSQYFNSIWLSNRYNGGVGIGRLNVWGELLRATGSVFLWRNGSFEVNHLIGAMYGDDYVTSGTDITESVLAIESCRIWGKNRTGVVLERESEDLNSEGVTSESQDIAQIDGKAIDYLSAKYENAARFGLSDWAKERILDRYKTYFAPGAGRARLEYDAVLDGVRWTLGGKYCIKDLPGSYFIDESWVDLENRKTEVKLVSL